MLAFSCPIGECPSGNVSTRDGKIVEIAPEIYETPSADDTEIDAMGLNFVAESAWLGR